jgi:hypothetical protein
MQFSNKYIKALSFTVLPKEILHKQRVLNEQSYLPFQGAGMSQKSTQYLLCA